MTELGRIISLAAAESIPFPEWVNDYVRRALGAENERLESELVEAIRLQDYDQLDRLSIVEYVGQPGRYVASIIDPWDD